MSATITTEITTEVRERKDSKRKSANVSFLEKINLKGAFEKRKLVKLWEWRNYDHGNVFITTLEVDYIMFDQNILIEDTAEIVSKLQRLGFVDQVGFPDEGMFKKFSRAMYNTEHNIAITLYQPKYKKSVNIAHDIMKKTQFTGESALVIFSSSIDVLIDSI